MSKSSSYRSSKLNYSNPAAQGQEQEPFFTPQAPVQEKKEEAFFQPKLTVGEPNDKFEKEADSVADKVVSRKSIEEAPAIQRQEISSIQRQEIGSIQRLATPLEDENFATNDQRMLRDRELREKPEVQLKCAHCEEEEKHAVLKKEEEDPSMVQRKSNQSARTAPDPVSSRIDSSRGNGSPLPASTLAEMQTSFGQDFSNVNIHTDADSVDMSRNLGAQAFTQGSDIYFNTGKFNPESSTGKHLLAHELTHVVQQGASGSIRQSREIQTKPKPHPTPAPKPEPVFFNDDAGNFFTDADRVGYTLNGHSFVFINGKGEPVPPADSTVGSMAWRDAAGKTSEGTIVRVKEVTVSAAADPSAGTGGKSVHLKQKGSQLGVFRDNAKGSFSDKIMQSQGSGLSPIAFKQLPPDVQTALGKSSVITMNNGQTWDLMFFHSRGESTDHMTWVKGESIAQQAEVLGEQSESLPEDLKKTIVPELTTMSAVSTDEGSFGATSGDQNDTMASLGIFQWGMLRNKSDNTSSMAMFFKKLKQRATAPVTGKGPSDEQQLYIDAWKACTDKGLDIDTAGYITLQKRRATGGQVEAAMHGVLGSNEDLKTYQMVASHDWIQDFKTNKVWPGPTGGNLGHGYSYGTDSATFKADNKHTVEVSAPGTASTVGDYFQSDKAVGMAVMLGVNRPHWVAYTIWRALDPTINPGKRTGELLTALMSKMSRPPSKPPVSINEAAATAAGPDALAAYQDLQSFLWPAKKTISNEDVFIAEFQRQAMSLYAQTEKTDRHRQHRFSTIEGAFHQ